jgi:hypothetical protein
MLNITYFGDPIMLHILITLSLMTCIFFIFILYRALALNKKSTPALGKNSEDQRSIQSSFIVNLPIKNQQPNLAKIPGILRRIQS